MRSTQRRRPAPSASAAGARLPASASHARHRRSRDRLAQTRRSLHHPTHQRTYTEQKCADTTGTVPVPRAARLQR